MDTSILLARLIGPLFVIVGLGVLLNSRHYMAMTESFIKNAELYYLSGAIAFVVGVAIVLFHNLWVSDWRVVLTIIGWMSVLKGAMRILFPTFGLSVAGKLTESNAMINGFAILVLIFGAWLSYQGFG